MIRQYTGNGWYLNQKGERVPCIYTAEDNMVKAACDICGDTVCDEDGDGGSLFVGEDEANEMALDYDWTVIGNHHICSRCLEKIEHGEIDIDIKVKGAGDGR